MNTHKETHTHTHTHTHIRRGARKAFLDGMDLKKNGSRERLAFRRFVLLLRQQDAYVLQVFARCGVRAAQLDVNLTLRLVLFLSSGYLARLHMLLPCTERVTKASFEPPVLDLRATYAQRGGADVHVRRRMQSQRLQACAHAP